MAFVAAAGWWRAYLTSPRRATMELALDRLADLESDSGRSDAERSLRILNAYLAWLERAPVEKGLRERVARTVATYVERLGSRSAMSAATFRLDAGTSGVAPFRRQLANAAARLAESQPELPTAEADREDVAELFRKWIDRELTELVRERETELRDLEFDLEVALSEALSGDTERRR